MENLFLFGYHVSIKVTPWLFTIKNRLQKIRFLVVFDNSVQLSDPHSSNFNIVLWIRSPFSNCSFSCINTVVNLSTKLRILIKIGNMRLTFIYSSKCFNHVFSFSSLSLGNLVILLFFRNKLQFSLSLQPFFKKLRSQLQFHIHFLHFS